MTALKKFKNLIDLLTYFSDEQVCRDYLEMIRWNGKIICPYKDCKHDHVFKYTDGKRYKCAKCQRQYSVRVGTIFEDSKIPLHKWYAAIYLITAHKKGISSLQLSRDISVTQKTAWYLLHRIRFTLGIPAINKLTGIIEADETFIGGKESNKHKSKRTKETQGRSVKTKSPVAGVMQRGGELRAKQMPDTSTVNVGRNVLKNVEFGSTLYTDEWYAYNHMAHWFKHKFIKHNEQKYVDGDTHVNSLEGFWSLLKRGIIGIYHSVSDKHLQQYVDEFVFRYNTRKYSTDYRFDFMLNNIANHISYQQLINGTTSNHKQVEAKQTSLGFADGNEERDVQ